MSSKKIPYSKGLPIFGHAIGYKKNRLKVLSQLRDRHGPIFKVRIGPRHIIVITESDYLKHIMQTNMKNYIKKTNFEQIFGQSVFIANGEEWKQQRNLIQPLLSTQYLNNSIEQFAILAQKNIDFFFKNKNTGQDLRELFTKTTFDIILKCIIGLDYFESYKTIDRALFTLTDYLANDNYKILPIPKQWDKKKQKFEKALREVNLIIDESINKSKTENSHFSLASILVQAAQQSVNFSKNKNFIRDNIFTLMFAGYETSALTLTWCCYNLSQNQDWQNKCIEEAKSFNNTDISIDSLKRIPAIESCLLETMRLYPPGWGFTRVAVEDDQIDGYHISQGDIILISPYLSHRSTQTWDDPNSFQPQRFIGKSLSDLGRFNYLPFGAGPRICSGMQFGIIEMKVIMLYLLKNYRVELTGEHPILDARATIYSKNNYQLKLIKHP